MKRGLMENRWGQQYIFPAFLTGIGTLNAVMGAFVDAPAIPGALSYAGAAFVLVSALPNYRQSRASWENDEDLITHGIYSLKKAAKKERKSTYSHLSRGLSLAGPGAGRVPTGLEDIGLFPLPHPPIL